MSLNESSMPKARAKIGIFTFQKLHRDMIKDHYEDNPYYLWKGYQVFGGGGSTLQLPDEGNISAFFGDHFKDVVLYQSGKITLHLSCVKAQLKCSVIFPDWY